MKQLFQEIRRSKGMNQSEFARAIGVTPQMVSLVEKGERKPGRQTLAGLLVVAGPEFEGRLLEAIKADNGGNSND